VADVTETWEAQRAAWCDEWPVSQRGNAYKYHDKFVTVVFPRRSGFGVMIEHKAWSPHIYASADDAKRAAFEAIMKALRRWPVGSTQQTAQDG
jgi:hypothetical protein